MKAVSGQSKMYICISSKVKAQNILVVVVNFVSSFSGKIKWCICCSANTVLRSVPKTGDSFPVCCVVTLWLSPSKGNYVAQTNLQSTPGHWVSCNLPGPCWLYTVVCTACWCRHHGQEGMEGARQVWMLHAALPFPASWEVVLAR